MLTQEQRAKFNPLFLKRVEDFAATQNELVSPKNAHGLNLIAQLILGHRLIALENIGNFWADKIARKERIPMGQAVHIAYDALYAGLVPTESIFKQINDLGFSCVEVQNRINQFKSDKFFFITPPENEDLAVYLASSFKLPFCSPGIDYFVGLAFGYGIEAVTEYIKKCFTSGHYKGADEKENV